MNWSILAIAVVWLGNISPKLHLLKTGLPGHDELLENVWILGFCPNPWINWNMDLTYDDIIGRGSLLGGSRTLGGALERYILSWPLLDSSLSLLPGHHEVRLCSTVPLCDNVLPHHSPEIMELANHGPKPLKLWTKVILSSLCQFSLVFCQVMKSLINVAILLLSALMTIKSTLTGEHKLAPFETVTGRLTPQIIKPQVSRSPEFPCK
jgi:hypothetical protein